MKSSLVIAMAVTAIFTTSSLAGIITGVTVGDKSSENTQWAPTDATKTIDGSGLNLATNTHDARWDNGWQSIGEATPWIVWDLGAKYNVDNMSVWNWNRSKVTWAWYDPYYGAKNVDIYTSADSNPATAVWTLAMNTNLNMATGTDSYNTPDVLALNGVEARMIKMMINTSHLVDIGWATTGTEAGLAEVVFRGTAVPEPATLALLGLGLGIARRFRK